MTEQVTTPVAQPEPKHEAKSETIDTDVFGVTIPLPVAIAKEIIAKRDERHKVFKDLDGKVKEYETKLSDAQRQAQAQKATLEGKLAEAESIYSQKANERLAKIHDRIVNKELESVLLADDLFIKESLSDAVKLLKADQSFALDEAGEKIVTKDGKDATEVIKDWIKNKPIFRKATGTTPTGARIVPGQKQTVAKPAEKVNWTQALNSRAEKK